MSAVAKACPHLARHPDLVVDYVLDSHLDMTDGFVHCRCCNQAYLLEMVDLDTNAAMFRVSTLASSRVSATIRSLQNGSCDVNRARNEVFSTANKATPLPGFLLREGGAFTRFVDTQLTAPSGHWRTLPCDGALLRRAIAGR